MRAQAKRCTLKELAYLSHWRSKGFMIGVNDPIPLNTVTPPSFATRRPVLHVLACTLISLSAVTMGCAWLAVGAGLLK